MRCAVIKGDAVINIIMADAIFDDPPTDDTILVNVSEEVQIGAAYSHKDGTFTNPEPPPPSPPPVPASVTRRQCALQLLSMKIISPVEALAMAKQGDMPVAIMDILSKELSPDNLILAQIDFAASNYYRSNSLLSKLGLDSDQIDKFFIAATQL